VCNLLSLCIINARVCDVCTQGISASIRNFSSRILQLDQESIKQTEIIYTQVRRMPTF